MEFYAPNNYQYQQQPQVQQANDLPYNPEHIPVDYKAAFTTGGFPGEEGLLEELGVNFSHIKTKTFTVLNPFRKIDEHLMDDADLAGPLLFAFLFGIFIRLSGKAQFSFVYGFAAIGSILMYGVMNLMSDIGMSLGRTTSVLGYCLLPMVILSLISIFLGMEGIAMSIFSAISIFWCTFSSSTIFVNVLQMHSQRILVAYPLFLLYAIFALIAVY